MFNHDYEYINAFSLIYNFYCLLILLVPNANLINDLTDNKMNFNDR